MKKIMLAVAALGLVGVGSIANATPLTLPVHSTVVTGDVFCLFGWCP